MARADIDPLARGKALLELRKTGRAPPIRQGVESVAAPEEDRAFSPEDATRIHAMLDRLNGEHREVLLLRFLEEMSHRQRKDFAIS